MSRTVKKIGADILASDRFRQAGKVRHHVRYTVADHSVRVAERAYRMAKWLNRHGFSVSYEDVIRGGLLHDIGMTDAEVHDSAAYRKAFSHPRRSRSIAAEEFRANPVQMDAIGRHMWPICVIPPKHMAGWLILAADKVRSVQEAAGAVLHS